MKGLLYIFYLDYYRFFICYPLSQQLLYFFLDLVFRASLNSDYLLY